MPDAIDGNIGVTTAKEFAVNSNVAHKTAVDDTAAWDASIDSVTAPGSAVDAPIARETSIMAAATHNFNDTATATQMAELAAAKFSLELEITVAHSLVAPQSASEGVAAVDSCEVQLFEPDIRAAAAQLDTSINGTTAREAVDVTTAAAMGKNKAAAARAKRLGEATKQVSTLATKIFDSSDVTAATLRRKKPIASTEHTQNTRSGNDPLITHRLSMSSSYESINADTEIP
ncbi:hypothetical protein ACH5RR_009953, partial [Cinchona calisaya]